MTIEQVADLADQMFNTRIAPLVAGQDPDLFLAIDVDSGDYEIATDDMTPGDKLRARHPGARVFLRRVGDDAAHFVGGSVRG